MCPHLSLQWEMGCLPGTAVVNPGKSPNYLSHFTDEQMDTQKDDTNAQVQGQGAP